ncbi:type II toxin-antitoxin system VapC family toxin [Nitriliruptor alkaliphilus]|uniref:type II toxin-antitoxin system VapC family toxin n=1 Tax=Nitriliruptor alkaliphilus TaxID=427918 RepID=UPI0006963523|nr:type II toxin-antitoxin system VapC family toxin [Nitriliruptor alkaliphilus]
MRYWDASAVVPLLVAEAETEPMRALLAEDTRIATWIWTSVEIRSAIERRARSGALDRADRRAALAGLDELASTWDEVDDARAVRRLAEPLLARHPLRAADAAQLAAALLISRELGSNITFVCLDDRLSDAAERESLAVEPAPASR